MSNPKVQNIGRREFEQGWYNLDPNNSVVISINDPVQDPPKGLDKFINYYCFYFLDIEDNENEFSFTDTDSEVIVTIIKSCISHNIDLLVHCNAGICRSGAVAELCEALGFQYVGNYKQPNILVKTKLFYEAFRRGML